VGAVEIPLAVTLYQVSVAIHVMLAIAVLGPTFAYPIIQMTAEKRFPRQLPAALQIIHTIDSRLVNPGAVLLLGTGIFQWIDGNWDMGEDQWLAIGFTLFIVMLGSAMTFLTPRLKKGAAAAERMVEAAGPDGEVVLSEEYKQIMRVPNALGPALAIGVLVIVYLMEVKPF
jgi:uncharacterized membrane protein